MKLQFHIAGGLLLCITALLLSAVLLPGETYARYESAAYLSAVVNRGVNEQVIEPDSLILSTENDRLTVTLPENATSIQTALKILSADQEYVDCTEQAPFVVVFGNQVQIFLGDANTQAGTYQLELIWESSSETVDSETDVTEPSETEDPVAEGDTAAETTATVSTAVFTFFVNYSGV